MPHTTPPQIDGPRLTPKNDTSEFLVILLHGYGADGENLIDLGYAWGPHLPKTSFVAPNAPFTCEENPYGYQWFSMRNWTFDVLVERLRETAPILEAFIGKEMEQQKITDPRKVALVGFSQGAMLSLYTGVYGVPGLGGILAYSGGFLTDPHNIAKTQETPEIFLYHGCQDPVVPVDASKDAKRHLKTLNIEANLFLEDDLEHAISTQGLEKGLAFLKQTFKI